MVGVEDVVTGLGFCVERLDASAILLSSSLDEAHGTLIAVCLQDRYPAELHTV